MLLNVQDLKHVYNIQIKQMWQRKEEFKYVEEHLPPKHCLGTMDLTENVNSFTEFDPLEVVVIGNIDETSRMWNAFLQYEHMVVEAKVDQLPQKIVKTAQEQNEKIVAELQKRGIKVVRSGYINHSQEYESNGIKTTGYNNFNPRDLIFAYHDSVYEFPTHCHCRTRQIRAFEWIEEKLHKNGTKIYRAPKFDVDYILYKEQKNWEIYKTDMVFGDAANLIKLGLDILFQISRSGSWGCYKKFRQLMEEKYEKKVRVHPIVDSYDGVHVDTTFCVIGYNKKLEKFLCLVNGQQVDPKTVPAIFRGKNWRLMEVNHVLDEKADFQGHFLGSEMIAINFLPINSDLILMNDKQTRLHEMFEYYGIECLKMGHTYGMHVGGAFHCMSNDLVRKDTYGFKQIIETPKKDLPREKLTGLFDPELLEFLESKGDIDDWVKICNDNNIYATYLTEHMTPEERQEMEQNHKKCMEKK